MIDNLDEIRQIIKYEKNERLDIDFKEWIDLEDKYTRADFAKDIASMANFGGGKLILGKSTNPYNSCPAKLENKYTQDGIMDAVRKYINPLPQCTVEKITLEINEIYYVISIAPHGKSPVFYTMNHPNQLDSEGRPGVIYTRKSGPQNAPVTNGDDFQEILNRCTMHNGAALIGMMQGILHTSGLDKLYSFNNINSNKVAANNYLKKWHDGSLAAFLEIVKTKSNNPNFFIKNHVQFSSRVIHDGNPLELAFLKDQLHYMNLELQDSFRPNWSMFCIHNNRDYELVKKKDEHSLENDQLFYEYRVFNGIHHDIWRISPSGYITIMTDYFEDHPDICKTQNIQRGSIINPEKLARNCAEFLRYTRALAERFQGANKIEIRCEWSGLGGRIACITGAIPMHATAPSTIDQHTSTGIYSINEIIEKPYEITAALTNPIMDIMNTTSFQITSNWIANKAPNWLR
jgi:hypothetical protein